MSDDSADKRAVGAHPDSFSGRAHPRWTSWTQADPDPMCFRSCIVDTQHPKGGGAGIGPTKRGKGMKIMAIVDRHGLPLSVSTHAANHHEVRLAQLCFDFYIIEAKPENLIGGRAYDSDPLDDTLRQEGIEMIAPHRSNRKKPPADTSRSRPPRPSSRAVGNV